jgi:formylglycine-generating enzyme required for sulfatase activity
VRRALANLNKAADDLAPHERAFLDADARARFLLAEDRKRWLDAARDPARLWTPDRFAACAGAGRLPEQDADTRAFLRASFDAALAAAADDPTARAAIGLTLSNLGDPRFDPAHWHLPADETFGFIEIPAGDFLMGTDPEQDPYKGWDFERPQHTQTIERPYWIGRYPVTVAAYRAFVEATSHEHEAMALEPADSMPAPYVSWHDARAYCTWLQQHCLAPIAAARAAALAGTPTGRFWAAVAAGEVRAGLPSEPEWERAARWTDGRIFPWGGDCQPALANYKDTRIGRASVVGCFSAGASVNGCEDMAGNLWEWTRSLWGKQDNWIDEEYAYPYERSKGDADPSKGPEWIDAPDSVRRVLRGGSFGFSSNYLRCAMRFRDVPGDRCDNVGFRVAWSPFL